MLGSDPAKRAPDDMESPLDFSLFTPTGRAPCHLMFISSVNYRNELISLVQKSERLCLAVAFWGQKSDVLIGEASSKSVRIICNLSMGGTNPAPIRILMANRNVEVRNFGALHAKVILVDDQAIIGSANMSTNGLRTEYDEEMGWEEAGSIVSGVEEVEAVAVWFERMWLLSSSICERDLELAQLQWSTGRNNRPLVYEVNGLFSVPLASLRDRRIYIFVWNQLPSKEAYERRNQIGRDIEAATNGNATAENIDFFENAEEIPMDADIISIYMGPRGAIIIDGVYRRIHGASEKFFYVAGGTGTIQLVTKEKKVWGFLFDDATREQLREKISANRDNIFERAFLNEMQQVIPLYEALRNQS